MNFDQWWNQEYNDSENPFEKDSFGYWAYAGWCGAMQVDTQEPVGYVEKYDLDREGHDFWVSRQEGKPTVPVYTAPPKRELVGLTDEEIIMLWESDNGLEACDMSKLFDFATVVRFITTKLKEKNSEG